MHTLQTIELESAVAPAMSNENIEAICANGEQDATESPTVNMQEDNIKEKPTRDGSKSDSSAQDSSKKNQNTEPFAERWGQLWFMRMMAYVTKHKGRFLRDEQGKYHLLIDERRIALDRGENNTSLDRLMLEAAGATTTTPASECALKRLRVEASRRAENLRFRHFSALSPDHKRLDVPLHNGALLQISDGGTQEVANGDNEDKVWLEHPNGCEQALRYSADVDVRTGLELFEQCVVNTQACAEPSMKWFVAMEEGLFPLLRERCNARFIVAHRGSQGDGKTAGAEYFLSLHGLGEVKGEYSVATARIAGDVGLLALDNLEHANLKQWNDFLLYASTGGESGRSASDGSYSRTNSLHPVVVMTSIEGVYKAEGIRRTVDVEYNASTLDKSIRDAYDHDGILAAIQSNRHTILSALMHVLVEFFRIQDDGNSTGSIPDKLTSFSGNYRTDAQLLRAYARVAEKPTDWANKIMSDWHRTIDGAERGEDALQDRVRHVLTHEKVLNVPATLPSNTGDLRCIETELNGTRGTLYITTATWLYDKLRENLGNNSDEIPKGTAALGRRLKGVRGPDVFYVSKDTAPDSYKELLKITSTRRPLGLFVPELD